MAKKFKDYYDLDCAIHLAGKLVSVYSKFNSDGFIAKLNNELADKEFLQRQDAFVDAFEEYLPEDYKKVIAVFEQILGPELETTTGMFTTGWWLWPVGRYVERHGIKDFQTSIAFIYELTKRFTGEFAIRPVLEKWPAESLTIIQEWSKDSNVHARRKDDPTKNTLWIINHGLRSERKKNRKTHLTI